MASDAMLKSARCGGLCPFIPKVHWLHALATATSIVSCGPSRISAAKSTAYDTDMVDPLLVSGRLTLKAELITERNRRRVKRKGCSKVARGAKRTATSAPAIITAETYMRAASGSDLIRVPVRCPV